MEFLSATDEGHVSAVAPPGDCILLRRSLATILFSAAFLFGAPAVVMIAVMIFQGVKAVPSPWWFAYFSGGISWLCGWLAMILWSGRSIPRWFLENFLLSISGVGGIECLVKGDWEDAGFLLGIGLYSRWQMRSALSGPKKSTLPEL